MYFVLKIAGSNWALHEIILEMIKYFTLPRWYKTLIYYRLRTLGGNLLHKNIVTLIICSQYGSITTYTSLLSKSQTSALQNKLWKWEKDIKSNVTWVPHFLSLLPAGPHPLFRVPAYLYALYVKGRVRTPVKVKRRNFYLKKLTLG